ncbi:MAG: hypothetical protein K8F91_11495 [Candidatus Obscuribacterales bacterium]|nr:hypothetical protein [Candidatus Obscuribacterales bacterium]
MSTESRQDIETVRRLVDNLIELADEGIEDGASIDPEEVKELAVQIGEILSSLFENDFGGWSTNDDQEEFFDGGEMEE